MKLTLDCSLAVNVRVVVTLTDVHLITTLITLLTAIASALALYSIFAALAG